MEQLAREKRALTAYVDESVGSVPEAMAAISRQFAGQGYKFKELERLFAVHRERRHEAEAAAVAELEAQSQGPRRAVWRWRGPGWSDWAWCPAWVPSPGPSTLPDSPRAPTV